MTSPADIDLIAQVMKGVQVDEHAFLAPFDRHASHMNGLGLHVLVDPIRAEGAAQDTFLSGLSKIVRHSI